MLPDEERKHIKCTHCGSVLQDDDTFCHKCLHSCKHRGTQQNLHDFPDRV
ncbi:zinc-ribbon domain-containing protein [Candidatus Woesearchaeota archaeon]|nr:zinc-ribbon domain-containing protein [Candidatus Woesearchaeota archaeon]